MNSQEESPVINYLATTYRLSASGGQSWQIVNAAMKQALSLAIISRFPFHKNDFQDLCDTNPRWRGYGRLDWERWFSEGGEPFYRLAVESRNIGAASSFERWKNRKPFIFRGQRLYEGFRFEWEPGDWWYSNSFAEDGTYINCGSYRSQENPMGWKRNTRPGEGPIKRMRLTVSDLKAQEKLTQTL